MLRPSAPESCEAGQNWYVCKGNGFTGCCSVDACNLSSCPDQGASTVTSTESVTTKTLSSFTTITMPTSTSSSVPSSASTTTAATVTEAFHGPGMVGVVTAASATFSSASMTASPSATQTPAPAKANNAPIIAGVVSGVVVVAMVLGLFWFYLHRRRRNSYRRGSIAEYGVSNKDFILERSDSPNFRELHISDSVFEPFAGQKSPSPSHTQRFLRTPVEDKPIGDVEKLQPPPIASHPVYHALRNSSPEHHPGTEIHVPNIPSPTQSPVPFGNTDVKTTRPPKSYSPPLPSPPLTQHPAYHISQLSQHPIFRSGPERQSQSQPPSPPLPHPRRTSPPREIPIPRLNTSTTRQVRSSQLQGEDPTSPIPGYGELPAEVPVEYHSPPPLQTPISAISGAWFAPSHPTVEPKSRSNPSGREQTHTRSDTTYSIPIGLGLQSQRSRSGPKSKFNSQSKPRPQSNIIAKPPTHSHSTSELPSPVPTISGTLATTKPGKNGEPQHIMSWANDLSIHHLAHSRSFNTIEIPVQKSTEKDIVSPVVEEEMENTRRTTPASFLVDESSDERWSAATADTAATSVSAYPVKTLPKPKPKPKPKTAPKLKSILTNHPASNPPGTSIPMIPNPKIRQPPPQQLGIPPPPFLMPGYMNNNGFTNGNANGNPPAFKSQQVGTFQHPDFPTPPTPKTAGSDGYGEGANTWGSWVDR